MNLWQRHHGRQVLDLLYAHRTQLAYPPGDHRTALDASTYRLTLAELQQILRAGHSIQADCSELAALVFKWIGCGDPNGLGFRVAGYTGTMLGHLPHYRDARLARTLALAVFGPGTGDHVSVVHTPDPIHGNPLMASHGGPGLVLIPLQTEARWHRPPVTLLNVSAL